METSGIDTDWEVLAAPTKYSVKTSVPKPTDQGQLTIQVIEGRNLEAGPQLVLGGFSNPYVILKVNGDARARSKWVNKNLNPRWDETFYLFFDHANQSYLTVEVWDKNWVFDDPLGSFEIYLWELQEGLLDRWFKLKNCSSGEIHLTIELKRPFGKKFFYESITGKNGVSILEDHALNETVLVPNKCLTMLCYSTKTKNVNLFDVRSGKKLLEMVSMENPWLLCTDNYFCVATAQIITVWKNLVGVKGANFQQPFFKLKHGFVSVKKISVEDFNENEIKIVIFGILEDKSVQLKTWNIPVELIPAFDSTLTIDPVFTRNISSCPETAEISASILTKSRLVQAIYVKSNKEPYLQVYDPIEGSCLAHLSPSDLPFTKGRIHSLLLNEDNTMYCSIGASLYVWDLKDPMMGSYWAFYHVTLGKTETLNSPVFVQKMTNRLVVAYCVTRETPIQNDEESLLISHSDISLSNSNSISQICEYDLHIKFFHQNSKHADIIEACKLNVHSPVTSFSLYEQLGLSITAHCDGSMLLLSLSEAVIVSIEK